MGAVYDVWQAEKDIEEFNKLNSHNPDNLHRDTFGIVNDIDDGVSADPNVMNEFVLPGGKSGDFEVFRNSEDNSNGDSENFYFANLKQRDDTNKDFENEENMEQFDRLKDESGPVENDTFDLDNDLDGNDIKRFE